MIRKQLDDALYLVTATAESVNAEYRRRLRDQIGPRPQRQRLIELASALNRAKGALQDAQWEARCAGMEE